MNDTRTSLEWVVGLASAAAGLVMLTGAWSLALRGRGLPWSLETVVEVHRQEPLLFLALFPPILAVAISVAYVRADQHARLAPAPAPAPVPVGRELLPPVPDGLVSVDEGDRIVDINRSAERMFGRASVELLGEPLDSVLDDRADAEVRKRLSGRGEPLGLSWTATARHRDGTTFEVEIAAMQRTAGQPRYLLVRAVPDADEPANRGRVDLLGELGRELRHPANVALAAAELALREATQLGRERLVAELRRVLHGCRSVGRVAEDLVDLCSEGEEGDGVVRTETGRVDVLALCDAVLDELEALGATRVELEPRGPIQHVRSDPKKLTRMLHLLLRGAGGPLRLRVWCTEHAAHLEARRTDAPEAPDEGAHQPVRRRLDSEGGPPAEGSGAGVPTDLQQVPAMLVERLANDLGVEVCPADDAMWHISLPLYSRGITPTFGEERTIPLDTTRARSATADTPPSLANAPAPPVNVSRPGGVSLRPTRLGPFSSRKAERTPASSRVRIAVLGLNANTRWAMKHALAARGIRATALEPNVALPHVLGLTRYDAVVVQIGAALQPLDALRSAHLVGIRLELVVLARAGREGCHLRCDSLHLQSDGAQVGASLARRFHGAGSAVVFHPDSEAREQLVVELRRAGWSTLVAGDVEDVRRLLNDAPELLVVDLTASGAVPLLAELGEGEELVHHVAVWPRAGVPPEVSQEWLASSPGRRPLPELVLDLTSHLSNATEDEGVGV